MNLYKQLESKQNVFKMKRIIKIMIIVISLMLTLTSYAKCQENTPTLPQIVKEDFIFRIIGYKDIKNTEWKTFDYTVPGQIDYIPFAENELKIFFKDEVLTISFGNLEVNDPFIDESGRTRMSYLASGRNENTGVNCFVSLLSISGDNNFYLAIANMESSAGVLYAIKLGY